ncbi:hypothetical protein F4810DRAFT_186762 [Camillea tinctor]|nr:hypothetical protein F4810DRAFT_186762 [Camillea tinctor]
MHAGTLLKKKKEYVGYVCSVHSYIFSSRAADLDAFFFFYSGENFSLYSPLSHVHPLSFFDYLTYSLSFFILFYFSIAGILLFCIPGPFHDYTPIDSIDVVEVFCFYRWHLALRGQIGANPKIERERKKRKRKKKHTHTHIHTDQKPQWSSDPSPPSICNCIFIMARDNNSTAERECSVHSPLLHCYHHHHYYYYYHHHYYYYYHYHH